MIRFWFERPTVTVPAGAAVTVPMSISAPRPAIADQVQRPFHVVAVESNRETEATGTLEQIITSSWARVLLIGGPILLAAAAALGAGWLIFGPKGNAPGGKPDNIPVVTAPPTTSSTGPTTTSSKPLPYPFGLPGTDAQGFIDYPGASCDADSSPAVMARTTKSVLVVCRAGPGDFYYRGLRLSDGASIELADAVRSSGGYDVTNPTDGTRYQIRPDRLTIIAPNGQVFTEQMVDYASI